jgi:hypothetical protein
MKISIQQQQQTAVKSVEISNPRKICTFEQEEEEERKTVQSLKIVRCLRVVLLDHLPVNHLHPFGGPSTPSNWRNNIDRLVGQSDVDGRNPTANRPLNPAGSFTLIFHFIAVRLDRLRTAGERGKFVTAAAGEK